MQQAHGPVTQEEEEAELRPTMLNRTQGEGTDATNTRDTVAQPPEPVSSDDDDAAGPGAEEDGGQGGPDVQAPGLEETADQREERERQAASARNQATAKQKGASVKLQDAKAAQRRLMRDLRSLQQTLASPAGEGMGLSAHPIDGDLFHWRAIIAGPAETAWEGGLFKLDLVFGSTYPLEPPQVRFLTKNVFHPNVYVNGAICLDTLKSHWSPTLDVESLLLSITSLLSDPNPRSAANGAAAKMLEENKLLYEERVRQVVEESLEQSFSDVDGEDEDEDEEADGDGDA